LKKAKNSREPQDSAQWNARVTMKKPKIIEDDKPEVFGDALYKAGIFCWHADNQGQHAALIIRVTNGMAEALLVTSNPRWNPKSRLASKRELDIFLGHTNHRPGSSLAPVVRPLEQFFKARSYPADTDDVNAYLSEFF
jgi:hypothetical protein